MSTIIEMKKAFHHYGLFKILSYLNINQFSSKSYVRSWAYYENILQQYIKAANYLNIFSKKIDLKAIRTDIDILPHFLGKSYKNILRIKGNPEYFFKEKDICIFVYKRKINGLNDRCKIHFYKNKVFLVNHYYPSTKAKDKIYVIKSVGYKYLNSTDFNIDITNCKIIDNNNNMIFIDDIIGLKVSYISNKDSEWFKGMLLEIEATDEIKNAKIKSQEKRFIASI
jgi:hypothetical protein